MNTLFDKIDDAMIMSGLTAQQVNQARAGAAIFGDNGLLDSLGLVRLISAVSTSFEDVGIDMFDMLVDLDVEAVEAFASRQSIHDFLTRVVGSKMAEAV